MGERSSQRPPDNSFRDGDPRLIDITDPNERAYWCKAFGISDADLLHVVGKVGSSAERVKAALRSSGGDRPGP
jgi:hypothetical protein